MSDPINPFNHIDLRVPRMTEVLPFYEALLPALGFTVTSHDPEWKVFATGKARTPSTAYFGLTEDRDHKPNGTRIAFWVPTRADVDRLARIVTQSGGRNVSGPKACPDYSPTYYAVFFDDPCGNRLEICHREN
jgi:predicted enzyme related to lactoylglutathione lyase